MSRVVEIPNLSDLLDRYKAGETEQKLAREAGVSRPTLRARIVAAGITPRTISDTMRDRWSRASESDRKSMIESAHAAVKGRVVPVAEKEARARTRQVNCSNASLVEFDLRNMLLKLGFDSTPQRAVGTYNVDVAIERPAIAVELFGGGWHSVGRHRERFEERTKYLLDLNWSVIVVWLDARRHPLGVRCANHIADVANHLSRHPTERGQYRVILGNGNPAPVAESNLNTESVVSGLGCRNDPPWNGDFVSW